MKKIYLLLLAGGLLASCGHGKKDAAQAEPTVNLDTVQAAAGQTAIQLPGRVRASDEISLAFKVSGRIQKILVKEGDRVQAGQIVAQMDATDYEVQLRATEAEYAQVVAEADRVIALYKENATTANNYDKAVYGKQQIEAKLKNHKDQLSYTQLRAPISGYIQDRMFRGGEVVSAGMPVLSMISGGTPEVEVNLPAAEYVKRGVFGNYTCTVDLYPDKVFQLRPISIAPKANANQLYTMRLAFTNQDDKMPSPGMNAMVTIYQRDQESHELTVPTGAILQKEGQESVFVYNTQQQTISKKSIKTLRLLSNGRCLITSEELQPGDLIVASGIHHVQDGQKVQPLKPTSKTNVGGLL